MVKRGQKTIEKRPIRYLFFVLCYLLFINLPLGAQTAVPLDETLNNLGASLRWDPFFKSGVLVMGEYSAAFRTGQTGEEFPLLLDNREILVLPAPFLDNGRLFFPEKFVVSLKKSVDILRDEDKERFHIAAIIVDPGHGGRDAGAVGNHIVNGKPLKLQEKDINLLVAKDLHRNLVTAYPDKRVLLTREGDTNLSLENRVSIAHSVPLKGNEAILFISIHTNASFNKQARGYEVWYLSPEYRRTVIDKTKQDDPNDIMIIKNAMMEEEYTTESILMAQSILRQLGLSIENKSPSRGIKAEEWFVVRNARMPSVLVELGFITNHEDAQLLAREDYLKSLSGALYNGITNFVTVFERSGGFIQER